MGVAASRQEAFWEACGFGHKERVKKFLESGDIDVNWVSYTHDCCSIHVASQGKSEIVRMLIEAKCNVNVQDIRGNTPVHHAAMKGHADIIKTLVEAGAEVNTLDKNSWTALHCAAYWNHSEAVRVLLNLGADVSLLNKDKRSALHETARSREKDDQSLGEITQMLIAEGSDVNCKGCSDLGDLEADFTGLMYAAYHNHPDVASALIEGECDINAHGSNLWTALHWAADRGHEEMVYLLLGSGADPTRRGQRNELAADRAEKPELKEMLLNAVNMYNELEILNRDSTPSDLQAGKNKHLEKNQVKSDKIDSTQSAIKNLAKEDISSLHEECGDGTNENMSGSNIDCCTPEEQSDINLRDSVNKLSLDTEQSMPSESHISPSVTDNIATDKVTNTETIEAEDEISDDISKCNNNSDRVSKQND